MNAAQLVQPVRAVPPVARGSLQHDPSLLMAALLEGDPLVEGEPEEGRLVDEMTRKVASRNGWEPEALDIAAYAAFGRSLLEERDSRLGDAVQGALRTRRGHVTRALLVHLGYSAAQRDRHPPLG